MKETYDLWESFWSGGEENCWEIDISLDHDVERGKYTFTSEFYIYDFIAAICNRNYAYFLWFAKEEQNLTLAEEINNEILNTTAEQRDTLDFMLESALFHHVSYREVNWIEKNIDEILNIPNINDFINLVFCDTLDVNLTTKERAVAFFSSYEKFELTYQSKNHFSFSISNDLWNKYYPGEYHLPEDKNSYVTMCQILQKEKVGKIDFASYKFTEFKSLFIFLSYLFIQQNYTLKICKNCGKYFYPKNRSDTIYCSGLSPQDPTKSCGEYVQYQNYLHKLHADIPTKLYKQIYNAKANAVRAMKSGLTDKQKRDFEKTSPKQADLNQFMAEAKQWKSQVKTGTKTEAEYINWLKSVKEKKV